MRTSNRPLSGAMLVRAALALVCAVGFSAHAQEYVDGSDGRPRTVTISSKELSRIAVEGGRIASFIVDPRELEFKEEPTLGQIFVSPKVHKPISAFVVTDSNTTHALVLEPRDVSIQTIIIREARRAKAAEAESARPLARSSVERASSYDVAIKRLILAMARNERPAEFTVQDVNQAVPLWREVRFVLMAVYRGRSMVGEAYRLTNVSNLPLRIAEQELFKDGVAGVSVELHELAPGQSTDVFVIRSAGNG